MKCGKYGLKPGDKGCPENKNEKEENNKKKKNMKIKTENFMKCSTIVARKSL